MATPSKLKPGDMVRRKDRADAPIFKFVGRRGSYCHCQCDTYRGLASPTDEGFVDVSDWDMARKYERVYTKTIQPKVQSPVYFNPAKDDELYGKAIEYVRASGNARISAVQAHFRIGYNRAARMLEAMEAERIASAPDYRGERQVLSKLNETRTKKAAGTTQGREWSRGYYCAVAVLLRGGWCVTADVRSLFDAGGGIEYADAEDAELFRAHGLV